MTDPHVSDPGVTLPAVTTPADQNRTDTAPSTRRVDRVQGMNVDRVIVDETLHDFDHDHDCAAEGCNVDAGFDVPTRLVDTDPAVDSAWWRDPNEGRHEMPVPAVAPRSIPEGAAEVIAEVAAGPDPADAPGAGEISLIQFGDPDRAPAPGPASPGAVLAIVVGALSTAGYDLTDREWARRRGSGSPAENRHPLSAVDVVRQVAADMGVDLNG
jgi:hypothetical protein